MKNRGKGQRVKAEKGPGKGKMPGWQNGQGGLISPAGVPGGVFDLC